MINMKELFETWIHTWRMVIMENLSASKQRMDPRWFATGWQYQFKRQSGTSVATAMGWSGERKRREKCGELELMLHIMCEHVKWKCGSRRGSGGREKEEGKDWEMLWRWGWMECGGSSTTTTTTTTRRTWLIHEHEFEGSCFCCCTIYTTKPVNHASTCARCLHFHHTLCM